MYTEEDPFETMQLKGTQEESLLGIAEDPALETPRSITPS